MSVWTWFVISPHHLQYYQNKIYFCLLIFSSDIVFSICQYILTILFQNVLSSIIFHLPPFIDTGLFLFVCFIFLFFFFFLMQWRKCSSSTEKIRFYFCSDSYPFSVFKKRFIYWFDFLAVLDLGGSWGLSLVAVSRGYSLLWCMGFLLRWLLLLQSMASMHADFSSCSVWTQ